MGVNKQKAIIVVVIFALIVITIGLYWFFSTLPGETDTPGRVGEKDEKVESVDSAMNTNHITVSIPKPSGDLIIEAEVARSSSEKAMGLMYREVLPYNSGMLFIYNKNVLIGFWMKNTKIPLDMIFIDENKDVVDLIVRTQPCKSDPCESYYPKSEYRYVLEVNGGWTEENKLEIGDQLEFE